MCIVATLSATVKAFWGDQLRFLQDNGFEITIVASLKEGMEPFQEGFPENVKIIYVKMSRTVKPIEDVMAIKKIAAVLREGKFDLVQYVTPKGAMFGSISSRFAKVPVRLYLMWGLYYTTQSGLKRCFFKYIEKLVCRLSTAIAPDSKGNLKLAVDEGLCNADKISVVGNGSANGVDTERFDPDRLAPYRNEIRKKHAIPQDAFVFGTVANVVRDKGINELIEAFNAVAKRNPKVYLLGIGEIPEKNPVTSTTLDLINNHERIIYIGKQTEIEKYFTAMDVFVLPTYREGFGVVNIEASAMRLPVISTDVPGPQESIVHEETGLLVLPKQVQPLTAAMETLLNQPIMAKKLGESGRKRVEQVYDQKRLWQLIVEHRKKLLLDTAKYQEENGVIARKSS
jgi:glycosyltransferase involved in cell wall biosynthesis